MDSYDRFQINSEDRHFYQEIRCFDFCVKNFKDDSLNKEEKQCIKTCFEKFKQCQVIFLNKMKENMEYLVIMDPALRLKFKEAQKTVSK